jgi:uncharacterized protein
VPITLEDMRRFAVTHSLFPPTTLPRALEKMGFVQADPIRSPARAQDLILRHRVQNYRAGQLEQRYAELGIEEDFFINYGFVTRPVQALMHPRSDAGVPAGGNLPWPAARRKKSDLLLQFVRERGSVHPREVDQHFAHGKIKNYWGGSSKATTHLLDAMHYQGLLRVVRRETGIRIYASHAHAPAPADQSARSLRIDALIDVAVNIYAPLTGKSLAFLIRRLRFAVPQWEMEIPSALERAKLRLAQARIAGLDWYWPMGKDPKRGPSPQAVRLLTPFDPVVWDRWRFASLWGWAYRFEAYTPSSKRVRGYYAQPLLWRDRVIGWGNVSLENRELKVELGYVRSRPPRDADFKRELEAELERMRTFLGTGPPAEKSPARRRNALSEQRPG